uniref:ETAA1 activator of ATR kinase n=1 Tax=Sphenodon punctatus TaxID=8508 RepID=A0A8D0L4N0_SPHPU
MASKRRKAADKLPRRSPAPERDSSRRRAAAAAAEHERESKAEETCLYKTPKRSLNNRSRLPLFNSPVNETDAQQGIFWDPHSPVAHKLGNERRKPPASSCMVEISEIVNRIAPQDEKPACCEGSLLGTWIGEDAIPCTPGGVKVRARTKINGTKGLQIKSTEEELMKLAKQFDENMGELEAFQEQDDHQEDAQMQNLQSFLDEVPETDTAMSLKPVIQSTCVPASDCCPPSSKSVDLEAEAALDALFDSSTQNISGRLSQGLTNVSLGSSFEENKSTLVEEKRICKKLTDTKGDITKEVCPRQNLAPALEHVDQIPTPGTKNAVLLPCQSSASCKTVSVVSSKPAKVAQDDFDDWDTDLLSDDSFVMQITQNPELISTLENTLPVPRSPMIHTLDDHNRAEERTNDCSSETKCNNIHRSPLKPFSKSVQDRSTSCPVENESNRAPNSKVQPVLLHSESDLKTDKNYPTWKSTKHEVSGYTSISVKSETKNANTKSVPSTSLPERKSSSVSMYYHPQPQNGNHDNNSHHIFHQPSNVFTNTKPNDLRKLTGQLGRGHLRQGQMPKKGGVSFEDWNKPRFSDEVLAMFCESISSWDSNGEDDDLLYQVCDDVEKQTQSLGNESAKNLQGGASKSDTSSTSSKQGLAQRKEKNRDICSLVTPVSGNPLNCGNGENPTVAVVNASSQHKYTQFQSYNQMLSKNITNSIPGKLYRSNSVPAGVFGAESSSINATSMCATSYNSKVLHNQALPYNVNKNFCVHKMSDEPSKFIFKKTNNSLASNHKDPRSVSSPFGIQQGLGKSQNPLQINQKPSFQRHLSDSFAPFTTGSKAGQKNRKYSQEEIERKKQEALERRKSKMHALIKNTAPT